MIRTYKSQVAGKSRVDEQTLFMTHSELLVLYYLSRVRHTLISNLAFKIYLLYTLAVRAVLGNIVPRSWQYGGSQVGKVVYWMVQNKTNTQVMIVRMVNIMTKNEPIRTLEFTAILILSYVLNQGFFSFFHFLTMYMELMFVNLCYSYC